MHWTSSTERRNPYEISGTRHSKKGAEQEVATKLYNFFKDASDLAACQKK